MTPMSEYLLVIEPFSCNKDEKLKQNDPMRTCILTLKDGS